MEWEVMTARRFGGVYAGRALLGEEIVDKEKTNSNHAYDYLVLSH